MLVYRLVGKRALLLGTTTARPVLGATEIVVWRTPFGGIDICHLASLVDLQHLEAEKESYKLVWVTDPAMMPLPVLCVQEGQSPRYLPNWTPE